jgi:cell division protein FtsB
MLNRNITPTARFILIAEFIVAIYMVIALTTSEYNSYKIEQYIKEFEAENQVLLEENNTLNDKYEYFTSPEYQEKIAKQNFGLVNPGEKVLIIPENSNMTAEEEFQNNVSTERIRFYRDLPNAVKWWYYFFG